MVYRLIDPAGSFSPNKKLRFSKKNPCDFFCFNGTSGIFYALELKTVNGSSIPVYKEGKEITSGIKKSQIEALSKMSETNRTVCGFVINFRKTDTTVFITVGELLKFLKTSEKKSINVKDIMTKCRYELILQKKKRTRYIYDLKNFF